MFSRESYRKPFFWNFTKTFLKLLYSEIACSFFDSSLFNLVVSWIDEFLGLLTFIANTDLIVRWHAYKKNNVRLYSVFDNCIVILYRMDYLSLSAVKPIQNSSLTLIYFTFPLLQF